MNTTRNFYVVGIGASAGGLEAIEAFFSKVPADSGLAFVIVQHLSPDYKSLMPEILIKRTSLPVLTAEDGMLVEPNHVYLIPRKMNMKIFHSRLQLTEKVQSQVLNLPIDIFLHSLAEDFEEKAVAVILSGTGSDGSRGIRMIKENGGMIIAQDADSAKFDGMPKSAISTGTVDFVLSPQDMPEKIISYVKHPYIKDIDKENIVVPDDYLAKIILQLKESFGIDFTFYKNTTISRRIERRLSINQLTGLKEYLDYLYSSKNEQKTLYKELLIGVTKFFRDTEAFQLLEKEIIPAIFANKRYNDEIRVWISACSTGEEAYSLAILLRQYMIEHKLNNDVKIFATDVDKSSVDYASAGVYNASITADVSTERLVRFFTQIGDSYKINNDIREMIVFATHNVIKDPPFNKIDLLSCRNLLIYFQPVLQQKVLSLFNFALNSNGYLFLGNSETLGDMESYYETINLKWKIYRSKRNNRMPSDLISSNMMRNSNTLIPIPTRTPSFSRPSVNDLTNVFTRKLLEDNTPDTAIVNENGEIINSFGNLNRYLSFPQNTNIAEGFVYSIVKMIPEALKLTFNIAINKVLKDQQPVIHKNVKYTKPDTETVTLDIKFVPLIYKEIPNQFVVIYFTEHETSSLQTEQVQNYEFVDQQIQQRIFDLENELKTNKENLQVSIEELETTNEELQATNEELISANEELQSTNEELQSVNEELYTVNTEFQSKNHDLVVMNNDMENLLQNSDIRIIFLDLDLKIRRFTDNITDIFNLKSHDKGRPISDITHRISNNDLLTKAKNILKTHQRVQELVRVHNRWYQMKILPYLTQKGLMDGVVMSFVDITDFYNTQAELKISENRFKAVIETLLDAFFFLSAKRDSKGNITDFIIIDINQKAEEQMAMTRNQLVGFGICELFPINITGGFFDKYKQVAETGVAIEEEYHIPKEHAAPGWYYHQVIPINDGIAIFNRDITQRKKNELGQQVLSEISEAMIMANFDINKFSSFVFEKLKVVINCEHGFIATFNDQNQQLEWYIATPPVQQCTKQNDCSIYPTLKITKNCFCSYPLYTKTDFFTNTPQQFAKQYNIDTKQIPWRNFLSVPLITDQKTIGQIMLADKTGNFDDADLKFVHRVATKYTMALLHAQNLQQIANNKEQ